MVELTEAKAILQQRIDCRRYLTKSKYGNYICPICGSGEGANHTGAVKYYEKTNTGYCHACKRYFNVIDLHMSSTGETFTDAANELAQEVGIEIDWKHRSTAAEDFAEPQAAAPSFNGSPSAPQPATAAPAADYTAYYEYCRQQLAQSAEAQEYLRKRGIEWVNAIAQGIGFDPQADPACAPGAMGNKYRPHPCPRIIIPTTTAHYVGRSIDPNTPAAFAKMNSKGSTPGIFAEQMLYSGAECVFVTEGAFDALSLLELNRHAIALNSTSNIDLLLETLEKKSTESTLIICFDNDADPQTAERTKKKESELKEGLRRLNISYVSADITGSHKDANEALTADRAAFETAVQKAVGQTAARPDNTKSYLDGLMAGEIEKFKQARNRKTGFSNLDEKAGGLNAGLYVLAAISSLGKTTLALQMADQIAAAGDEVLFFSMEQSRLEMISKSLARITAQADMKTAVNSLAIRQGYLPPQVTEAVKQYKAQTGERLSIIEGNFNCDIGYIADYIRGYIKRNGENVKPVIFIDYLQILQPAAEGRSRGSKKDEIDLAVTELKRLSRELDLTIIVISSLNRANYMTPFAFESLKESGGIEYTADVVWGLQLACLDEPLFNGDEKKDIATKRKRINDAKEETPRKIKFVCLKNRYGISHYECAFNYYPANDLFIPAAHTFTAGGKQK